MRSCKSCGTGVSPVGSGYRFAGWWAFLIIAAMSTGCGSCNVANSIAPSREAIQRHNFVQDANKFVKEEISSWIKSPTSAQITIDETSVTQDALGDATKSVEVFRAVGTVQLKNKLGQPKKVRYFIEVRDSPRGPKCRVLDIGNVPLVNQDQRIVLGVSERIEIDDQDDISGSLKLDRLKDASG